MSLALGYANALYDIEKSQQLSLDSTVSNLMKLLVSKGHIKLLPHIVDELEKIVDRGRDKKTITLTCAREKDFATYRSKLKEHVTELSREFTEEIVDDTLIGGYVIQKDDVIVDGSYKQKLLLIYRNATA